MNKVKFRKRIAKFGLASVIVGTWVFLANPTEPVDPNKILPTGYRLHFLYRNATGLTAGVCDGIDFGNCDSESGLAKHICRTQGAGVVRNSDGTRSLDGYWQHGTLIYLPTGECAYAMYQLRAQRRFSERMQQDGGYPIGLLNSWEAIQDTSGWGVKVADLPVKWRDLARTHRYWGRKRDTREARDDGGFFPDSGEVE